MKAYKNGAVLALGFLFLALVSFIIYAEPPGDEIWSKKVRENRAIALSGDPRAQLLEGNFHLSGKEGRMQNFSEAIQWYRKAALQNNPTAQFQLGLLYAEGTGVEKDNVEAFAYWSVSAANGFPYSEEHLEKIRPRMTAESLEKGELRARDLKREIDEFIRNNPKYTSSKENADKALDHFKKAAQASEQTTK